MWDADVDKGWEMSQRLAKVGLFGGQSSGCYLQGAYDVAKSIGKGVIVTVINDIGDAICRRACGINRLAVRGTRRAAFPVGR